MRLDRASFSFVFGNGHPAASWQEYDLETGRRRLCFLRFSLGLQRNGVPLRDGLSLFLLAWGMLNRGASFGSWLVSPPFFRLGKAVAGGCGFSVEYGVLVVRVCSERLASQNKCWSFIICLLLKCFHRSECIEEMRWMSDVWGFIMYVLEACRRSASQQRVRRPKS